MTQLELARDGTISRAMKAVAKKEGLDAEMVRQGIADGLIVITANIKHRKVDPCGIGKGLRTPQIMRELGLQKWQVDYMRLSIYKKTATHSAAQLSRYAIEHDMV